MKTYITLALIPFLLISCGGSGEDRSTQNTSAQDTVNENKLVLKEQSPDQLTEDYNILGHKTVDSKGNEIVVYYNKELSSEGIIVEQGIDYGTPTGMEYITNYFIKITYPDINKYAKTIVVKPSKPFNTILIRDKDGDMVVSNISKYISGGYEIVTRPNNGIVEFAFINDSVDGDEIYE